MIEWEKHTWMEIEKAIRKTRAAILPVGSIEQHGPHLPLACDTIGAYKLSLEIARRLKDKILVLPPIYYGVSEHHMDFPGTITLRPETLISLVFDIAESLRRHGMVRLIIINGHGGNTSALLLVIRSIREKLGMEVVLINPWELIKDVIEQVIESKIWGHACEFETSLAYIEMPELIRVDKIIDPEIRTPHPYAAIWERNIVHFPWRTKDFTNTGSIGFPSKATREKGEKLWSAIVERVLGFVRDFIGEDK